MTVMSCRKGCSFILIVLLIFAVHIYEDWQSVDIINTLVVSLSTKNNEKCAKWKCTINDSLTNSVISTCWDVLPNTIKNKYKFSGFAELNYTKTYSDFTIECEGKLINIIPEHYKGHYQYIILNLYYFGSSFSLYLNSKPIHMIKYETNDGEWLVSSNPNKILINDSNLIKFIYFYKLNSKILPHFHLNYIGYNDNKNIYSSGIWSIIPNILPSFENKCNKFEYIKSRGNKDWSPCLDEYLYDEKLQDNECIIYSVGVSGEYQFDVTMGNMGCTVYMFDCTVKYDYNFSTNVIFYPWCLIPHNMSGNKNKTQFVIENWGKTDIFLLNKNRVKYWDIYSIIDVIKHLNHENKTINIFKIDCEGCEYDILNDLINYKNYIKTNIKQIYIELHTFKNFKTSILAETKYMNILNNLFNVFTSNNFSIHQSNINCGPIEKIPDIFEHNGFLPYCCCYEYQLINVNLINQFKHDKWYNDINMMAIHIPHHIAARIVNKTNNQKIPKRIIQTWKTHKVHGLRLRQGIFSWINLNPDYEYYLYDDKEADDFVKSNYNQRIYKAYNTINPNIGAAKADFWRYLIINKIGGIYADIDTLCIDQLNSWIYDWDEFIAGSGHNTPSQFLLISIKEHLILNETIKAVLQNIDKRKMGAYVPVLTGPNVMRQGYQVAMKHNMFHQKKDFIVRKILNPKEWKDYSNFNGHIKMKVPYVEQDTRNITRHWTFWMEHNFTHIWTDLNATDSEFKWY